MRDTFASFTALRDELEDWHPHAGTVVLTVQQWEAVRALRPDWPLEQGQMRFARWRLVCEDGGTTGDTQPEEPLA